MNFPKNQIDLKPIISGANDVNNLRKGLELNHTNSFSLAEYICEFTEKNSITLCLHNKPIELVNTVLSNTL